MHHQGECRVRNDTVELLQDAGEFTRATMGLLRAAGAESLSAGTIQAAEARAGLRISEPEPEPEGQLHLNIRVDRDVLRLLGRIASRLANQKTLALRGANRQDRAIMKVAKPVTAPVQPPAVPPSSPTAPPVLVVGRSVAELLIAYEHDLARRGPVTKQQRKAKAAVQAVIDAMEIRTIEQLTVPAVKEYLARRRRENHWGPKTHDNHLSFLRDFGKFLVEERVWADNPLAAIRGAKRRGHKYGTDHTGDRAFQLWEIRAIIAAAEESEAELEWIRDKRRSACYRLFALTGLRHLEMKKLPWAAVFLDDDPRIVCDASWTKNGKTETIPLTPEAVELLSEQRQLTGNTVKVWKTVPSLNVLNKDMARGGVPKVDERGRPAGFHSFRKGLNTLARHAGVDLDTRQRWLRHDDPKLTSGTYSDVLSKELAAAARLIPRILTNVRELSTKGGQNLTTGQDSDDDVPREAAFPSPTRERPGPGSRRGSFTPLQREFGPVRSPRTGPSGRYGGNKPVSMGGSNPPLSACPPVRSEHPGAATFAAALKAAIDAFVEAWVSGGQEPPDGTSPR